jgi:hypothetical protein
MITALIIVIVLIGLRVIIPMVWKFIVFIINVLYSSIFFIIKFIVITLLVCFLISLF